jgi:hypothetical protein
LYGFLLPRSSFGKLGSGVADPASKTWIPILSRGPRRTEIHWPSGRLFTVSLIPILARSAAMTWAATTSLSVDVELKTALNPVG